MSENAGRSTRPMPGRTAARALAVLLLAAPLQSYAACRIETMELPVRMVGTRAVATVGVNGTPVPLTVDSGAFFSMLTEPAAAQLQLRLRPLPAGMRVEGITGSMNAHVTTIDKLELLKGSVPRVEFIVGGNEPGGGTMGLLGRNILAFTDTEYDLANGVIRFSFPNDDCRKANLAYWADGSQVTVVDVESDFFSRGRTPPLRVRVKLNGTELVALLDTGATTVVTAQAARRAGVGEAQMAPAGQIHGVGRGSARSWTAPFERFEIGGETIANNRLRVGDFTLGDADLLLGIDFFLSHRLYVSKAQEKLFLTYNGGTVFALNRSDNTDALPPGAEPAASGADGVGADQLARRAAALAARRDYERALAEVNRAVELEPGSAAHLAQRGEVLAALRHPDQAMDDFDRALSLDPANPAARFGRAALRAATNNPEGARTDLDALDTSLAPQADARLAMARLYLALDEPSRSLAQLDHWLGAHADEVRRPDALNSRCWARAMLGTELAKALADCDAAVSAEPRNAAFFDSRGWVQLRLASNEKAVADFDRSLALRPGGAWSLYGRGLAKTRLGDAARGDADLDAARKAQADIDERVKRSGLTADQTAKR